MRNSFDEQLKELNRELIEMGSLCEQIISGAIGALLKNSEEQRRLVDSIDGSIDRKERDIENLLEQAQKDVWRRWNLYQNMAAMPVEKPADAE